MNFSPLTAKQIWNDRYFAAAKARYNWQIVAAVFALLAVSSQAVMLYVLQEQKFHVIVAQVDNLGRRLDTYEVSEKTVTVPQSVVIAKDLADFIEHVRSVGADYTKKREEYQRVKERVTGEAAGIVEDFFKTNPPNERMKSQLVNVLVNHVKQQAGKSWTVRWTEETRNKVDGALLGTTRWEATLVVELQEPQQTTVLTNPFGITITALSWGEVKGGEQ